MAVTIGSARSDERGKASGGRAGDQTGHEVSTQRWYKHSKGWILIRAKTAEMRERIAWDMQAACDNPNIGYDQSQNTTLWSTVKPLGFDCSKVVTPCETDCARLVRVCCWYGGSKPVDFYTGSEVDALRATGDFNIITDPKYTDTSQYLLRGDILVTRVKGHTVVVLSDGSKSAPRMLKKGMKGYDVQDMQTKLIEHGYTCGKWGADGDFGQATEDALKAFQRDNGLEVDGIYGAQSRAALESQSKMQTAYCTGDEVNYRETPSGRILGQLNKGDSVKTTGEQLGDWTLIHIGDSTAWVYSLYLRY